MSPICLALDYNDLQEADQMLARVRNDIGMIKIGPELFYSHGRDALELGNKYSCPIFLDLKLHDIPSTVSKTVHALANGLSRSYPVRFLSVHSFGGQEMIRAAIKTSQGSGLQIAAVTLLTSLTNNDLGDMGFRDRREGVKTMDLAWLAFDAGARAFVSSPTQTHLMKKHFDKPHDPVTLITPGIRAEGVPQDDQKRAKPIGFAIRNGSDWAVVGRPITQDPSPEGAAQSLLMQALKAKK